MKLQAKFPSFCHLLSSVLAFAVLFAQSGASFPAFAAEAAPAAIQISSGEELARIGKDAGYPMDGDYELTGDITLEGNWIPLGGYMGGRHLQPCGRQCIFGHLRWERACGLWAGYPPGRRH